MRYTIRLDGNNSIGLIIEINTKIINVNMKQKKIGTDLYVFDTSAYQLTKDLDAENIYIQQELIPAYEKLNSSSVNAKIKPYNYKLNIIQKPVWGDYIYAEEEVTEPEVKFGIGLGALIEHAD